MSEVSVLSGVEEPVVGRRTGKPPRHWAEMSEAERTEVVRNLGWPAFRADQLSRHYFERHEDDPASWSDLPKSVREVSGQWFPSLMALVAESSADRGATIKSLYELFDGTLVECVLMRYLRGGRLRRAPLGEEGESGSCTARSTLCVSSQAGCGIGCPFCATGQAGLQRNLTSAEIIEQVRRAVVLLGSGSVPGGAGRLNNVVFMGMGEPLANYRAVVNALRAICEPTPHGFGISARGITVSTAGMVPRIADLAGEGLPVTLAVSLHAPDDELRDELVPINRRWPVSELLDAARAYFEGTGRRVSIEYALMRDVNDQGFRADLLAKKLVARGRGWVHVNLIPLNPTPGSPWTASRPEAEAEFVTRLEAARVPVTLRDTRGRTIDGACGQLAAKARGESSAQGHVPGGVD